MPESYLTLDLFFPNNNWKVYNSCYISQTSFCMLNYKQGRIKERAIQVSVRGRRPVRGDKISPE
jgi:hypothetical protein